MNDAMVERVARAVRRRKFERTERLSCYDDTWRLSHSELDDARAAIDATAVCDLLEACEALIELYSGLPAHRHSPVGKARAAIAKAKGERHE